jgi:hypothetical protein
MRSEPQPLVDLRAQDYWVSFDELMRGVHLIEDDCASLLYAAALADLLHRAQAVEGSPTLLPPPELVHRNHAEPGL